MIPKRNGNIIKDLRTEGNGAVVVQFDAHGGFERQLHRRIPQPMHFQLRGARETTQIPDPGSEDDGVPKNHRIEVAPVRPRRANPDKAD